MNLESIRPCALGTLATLPLFMAAPSRAEPVRINLKDAGPEQISREASRALGTVVEVRGGKGRTLTLDITAAAPERALDRLAATLGGTWKARLRVRGGGEPLPHPGKSPEQFLALGLQDITAARAFALVARELKADLDTEGDLDRRVSLLAVNVSAGTILDRIAAQSGATWSLTYTVEAPDIVIRPPVEPVRPAPAAPPRRVEIPTPPVSPMTFIPAPPAAGPLTGPELKTQLWSALNRVLRIPPDRREEAVWEFVFFAEGLFRGLEILSSAERLERVRFAMPLLTPWRSLFKGLAPNVQKQLNPITECLERHLRP